jgi:hypothetical protein
MKKVILYFDKQDKINKLFLVINRKKYFSYISYEHQNYGQYLLKQFQHDHSKLLGVLSNCYDISDNIFEKMLNLKIEYISKLYKKDIIELCDIEEHFI